MLERQLKLIEDREAIRELKHHNYCHCVDRAVGGDSAAMDELLSHFTQDILADFTGFPLMKGYANVSPFFANQVPALLSYSQHRVMNDIIKIDGDTATGRWYVDCPVVFRPDNAIGKTGPGFIGGRYEETYRRENGIWKFSRVTALLDVLTEFKGGWPDTTQVFRNR